MTAKGLQRPWKKLTPVAFDLIDSRLQLHWAIQVLASVGAAYAEKNSDDSHRNLEWSKRTSTLRGNLTNTDGRFRMALHPLSLELRLLDENDVEIISYCLLDQTLDEGFHWTEQAIGDYSSDCDAHLKRPEYELPFHAISTGAKFGISQHNLKTLDNWYANADLVLREIANLQQGFSPVRCWPHHFDIATLLVLGEGEDLASHPTVGVGMSPGDDSHAEPYWYVSPWPYPESGELPQLPSGHWHRKGWTGAVLLASDIDGLTRAEDQLELVLNFMSTAVEGATELALAAPS